jgi:AraC-like DNA-binding protein
MQPGAMIQERMIWDYEILYVKQGSAEVTVDKSIYHGITGDVFLFKPGQRHSIRVLGVLPLEQPHVHFDLFELEDSPEVPVSFKLEKDMDEMEKGWFRTDLLSGPDIILPNFIRLTDYSPFEEILFNIIREYQMKTPFSELRLKGLVLELLVYLLRNSHSKHLVDESDRMNLLMEIQQYLNLHANRELTLDELSDQFHMNKHYLIDLFKNTFQITPIQYHQKMRIARAKNMLKYTDMSIQEISDTLGYISIHSFSRAFKNKVYSSPTTFRTSLFQSD